MQAGQKYYVEALHKEAGGGDNLVIGWRLPTSATNANPVVIPGSALSPFVPSASRQAVGEEITHLQAAPNPFSSTTTVTFHTETAGKAQLDLFDLSGIQIQSLFEQPVLASESHQVVVDGHTLPEGLYLLRLVQGNKVYHLKVMLAR
ncbi:MAG: T9SS type A sorting domain-containing protein [Bacteroidota bacterium]